MQELPAFSEMHKKYQDRIEFINVSDSSRDAEASTYWEEKGYEWLLAESPEAYQKYVSGGIPLTLFIDAQGNLKEQKLGAMSEADLESTISQLL